MVVLLFVAGRLMLEASGWPPTTRCSSDGCVVSGAVLRVPSPAPVLRSPPLLRKERDDAGAHRVRLRHHLRGVLALPAAPVRRREPSQCLARLVGRPPLLEAVRFPVQGLDSHQRSLCLEAAAPLDRWLPAHTPL